MSPSTASEHLLRRSSLGELLPMSLDCLVTYAPGPYLEAA